MAEIEVRITKTQKPLLIMFLENTRLVVNWIKRIKDYPNWELGTLDLEFGLGLVKDFSTLVCM